jgi:hypothetical protein
MPDATPEEFRGDFSDPTQYPWVEIDDSPPPHLAQILTPEALHRWCLDLLEHVRASRAQGALVATMTARCCVNEVWLRMTGQGLSPPAKLPPRIGSSRTPSHTSPCVPASARRRSRKPARPRPPPTHPPPAATAGCAFKGLYRAAVRFAEVAFAAKAKLLAAHRYSAACYAVLAGGGLGKDKAPPMPRSAPACAGRPSTGYGPTSPTGRNRSIRASPGRALRRSARSPAGSAIQIWPLSGIQTR